MRNVSIRSASEKEKDPPKALLGAHSISADVLLPSPGLSPTQRPAANCAELRCPRTRSQEPRACQSAFGRAGSLQDMNRFDTDLFFPKQLWDPSECKEVLSFVRLQPCRSCPGLCAQLVWAELGKRHA